MTDKVHPSFNREAARSRETAAAIGYGGGTGEGFIWPSTDRLVEDSEGDLATGPLDAFDITTGAASFDVTIQTGEAIRGGAYLARDATTTVTLPASSTTTLSLGWKDGAADTVLIGEVGTAVGDTFTADDPRAEIWTVTTDGSGVTATTDERTVTQSPGLPFAKWEWVDVTEAGLANDGSEDAGAFINANVDDNTLLIFPPGTYTFDTEASFEDVSDFGLWAPTGGVTFTEGALGLNDDLLRFGKATPVEDVLVSGIDTDVTEASFADVAGDGIRFENIRFTAERTAAASTFHIACYAPNRGDTIVLDDVRMPEGGAFNTTATDSPGGIYVRGQHAGTLRARDCEVGGFANNGLYASAPGEAGESEGKTIVEGGTYRDSAVASIRIGGDGSAVRDSTIELNQRKTNFGTLRGIYVRNGTNHQIDNITLRFDGSIVGEYGITVQPEAGTVTIADCSAVDDGSNLVVRTFAEDTSRSDPVTVEGITVEGTADTASRSYPLQLERDGTRVSGADINQPNRSGINPQGADCVVENSTVNVSGTDVKFDGPRGVARDCDLSGPVAVDAVDCRLEDPDLTLDARAGEARTLQNGWGTNDGDPSSTGEWNGFGYEGLAVYDTNNGVLHRYLGGTWRDSHEWTTDTRTLSSVVHKYGTDDEWGLRHLDTGTGTGQFELVRDPTGSLGIGPQTVMRIRRSGNPNQLFGERYQFQNTYGTGDGDSIVDIAAGQDTGSAYLRWFQRDAGISADPIFSGQLGYSNSNDAIVLFNGDLNELIRVPRTGTDLIFPEGGDGAVNDEVASGVVTLSSGSAEVSTGITTTGTRLNVFLDPSGDGANTADVKAAARAFWDNAAGEYKVEILEDGTSVGNPDVGYKVTRGDPA